MVSPPVLNRRPVLPHHVLAYIVSLPERIVRIVGGLVGQLGFLLSRLLPRPIREGKFYKLAVERQFRMLTDELGRARLFPNVERLSGDTAKRMAVGGAVDNLMMVGLHASPLWILLAATDVSNGAAAFLEDLGRELREAGVMSEDAKINALPDVLRGLSRLSDSMAVTMDTPPLTVDGMKETISRVREELEEVGGSIVNQVPDLDALAGELVTLSEKSDHSLIETTGALAIGTMRTAGNILAGGLVGTTAVLHFVKKTVWDDVFQDYFRTAKRIHRRGFYGGLRTLMRPQHRSIRGVMHYRFLTWTERLLSLFRWSKAPWVLQG